MSFSDIITLLGFSLLFFYSLSKILVFYGINEDVYGVFVLFYMFLILSKIILPNKYPSIL
jgi:hypothetical protein